MGWTYGFLTRDGARIKIGYGDAPQRLRDVAITERLDWGFAIPTTSDTQEKAIHRHFMRYRDFKETFHFEAALKKWVEELRRRPGVATCEGMLPASYATPGWLPWQGEPLPPIERQQALRFGDERLRKPRRVPGQAHNLAALSSTSDDWFTPPLYVDAARRVMGTIDLDPASCAEANSRFVHAEEIYTIAEDGLQREWHGNVWLNPPYGGAQRAFVGQLLAEYEAGRVTAAVALLNANTTDTEWFQPLWKHMLCFTHHRIRFIGPDGAGDGMKGGTVGSVFVYLGRERERFAEEFGLFGAVVEARVPRLTREEFKESNPGAWTVAE